jgi:succinate dehydrogenase / fumarate reductase cytochrome b subunit
MAQATSTKTAPTSTATRPPVTGTATGTRSKLPFPLDFYRTSVGKKVVMAVTGLMLFGFVFAHMVGNLKMYLGPSHFDEYAEFLRRLLVPILPRTVALWLLRLGLIGAGILHVHAAVTLTIQNRKARPMRYQSQRDYIAANFASRSMRLTGIVVFLFLFWHLGDLTWGWFNPNFHRGAAYENVDASLSRVPVAILYIAGNLALGVHLWHGLWSLFQSLGWNNPRFNKWRRGFAWAFSGVIVVANVSFPIAVLAGIVGK